MALYGKNFVEVTSYKILSGQHIAVFSLWSWIYWPSGVFRALSNIYDRAYLRKLLRYYASFKVRKSESLFCKINTCLQKTISCIGLQVKQMFSPYIWYIYFSIFGVAFVVPFPCCFQKLQHLVIKNFGIIFAALYFYLYELKKGVSDFLNLISNWRY